MEDGVHRVDLTPVDLECFKSHECAAGTVYLGLTEIEVQQDDAQLIVNCRDPRADIRMLDYLLGLDVLAARTCAAGARGMNAVFYAIGVRRKRGVNLHEAADAQALRIFQSDSDRLGPWIDFRRRWNGRH